MARFIQIKTNVNNKYTPLEDTVFINVEQIVSVEDDHFYCGGVESVVRVATGKHYCTPHKTKEIMAMIAQSK